MSTLLAERVQETAAAPGTGAVTLGGAVTGYQTFAAGVGSGNTTPYVIQDSAGNWEYGLGTVGGSGPYTLTRTTPRSGSAATPVNFASSITVFSNPGPPDLLVPWNNLSDVASTSTAFNNISPITSIGDLIIGTGTNVSSRLSIGGTGSFLISSGATAAWGNTVSSIAANVSITGSGNAGAFSYGNLSFSDVGLYGSFTASSTTYTQMVLQNTNSGSGSSTDYIVANNNGTSTSYYGDFGINSSTFSGTGSLGFPNATYLYASGGDLALGTSTANSIHFVVNSGSTDAMSISAAGVVSIGSPGLLLAGSTSGTTAIKANATAGSWSLVLPSSAGSSGNVLSTDGSGNTSWINPTLVTGSGAPVATTTSGTIYVNNNSGVASPRLYYSLGSAGTFGTVQLADNAYHRYTFGETSGGVAADTGSTPASATYNSVTLNQSSLTAISSPGSALWTGQPGVTYPFRDPPGASGNSPWTIEFMYYPTSGYSGFHYLFTNTSAGGTAGILFTASQVQVAFSGGSATIGCSFSTAIHHVVLTYDGTFLRLYIDASLIGSPVASSGTYVVGNQSLASSGTGSSTYEMQYMAFYNYALSLTQITNHYSLIGSTSNYVSLFDTYTLAALTDVNVTEGAGIDGLFLKWNNSTSKWVASTTPAGTTPYVGLEFIISGGSSVITTGIKGYCEIPFPCTVIAWTIILYSASGAAVTDSITIDVLGDTYANTISSASIVGTGTKPFVTAATKNQSTPTGWTTTTIPQGEILGFNVTSAPASAINCLISLKLQRT